jgi:hypothetical protein
MPIRGVIIYLLTNQRTRKTTAKKGRNTTELQKSPRDRLRKGPIENCSRKHPIKMSHRPSWKTEVKALSSASFKLIFCDISGLLTTKLLHTKYFD